MSSRTVLNINHVSKVYHIYDSPSSRLRQMLLSRFGKKYYREFWALSDLSLSIEEGKIYGILGKNGAGKSTLLQIVCGILEPTCGSIKTEGRISALLELGSGFNPEFTGTENIYLNAQLLGLDREETNDILQEVIDFADIGDFIGQPVKTYSSGMFARLAFSVAVNVAPDLLIVDEALSVGDSWFQHKSMARMRQLMESGCSVLFVSHSIDAVRALCDEAIWLEQGKIKMQGNVTDVTNAYMNDVFIEHNRIVLQSMRKDDNTIIGQQLPSSTDQNEEVNDHKSNIVQAIDEKLNGSSVLTVRSKILRNSRGEITEHLQQGEPFSLDFTLEIHKRIESLSGGILIKDRFGQDLTGASYFNSFRESITTSAGDVICFSFRSVMSFRGGASYSVSFFVNQVSKWDRTDNIVIFADHVALAFDVMADAQNPMWFLFNQSFDVKASQIRTHRHDE
jgi:lipopolysaccharide transport system ATP-binding protein